MAIERIVIIGPGAMGLLHAAYLHRAGLPVELLDHRRERAQRLADGGFHLITDDEEQTAVRVPCTATAAGGPCDLLIVMVKAWATRAALTHAKRLIGPATIVLTLQNGLGNLEILQEFQNPRLALGGTTSSGATLLAANSVRQAGIGVITLGSPAGNEAAAQVACSVFELAGLPAKTTPDAVAVLWRKAVINAAVNPVTALTGLRNGRLLQHPELRALMGEVVAEAVAVAHTAGVVLDAGEMTAAVEDICRLTAHNKSSMLQDLSAGRRTEIREISGVITRLARQADIAAPLNTMLAALVAAAEQSEKTKTD